MPPKTLGELSQRPVPRSFWRDSLAREAAPLDLQAYLIDEANLRGFWGTYRSTTPDRPCNSRLSLEDVVVALLAPQAPIDGRAFKLIVRMLQSERLDLSILLTRAHREGAIGPLFWLVERVPASERTPALRALQAALAKPPRGYRPLAYDYDPARLVRRPARQEDLWRKPPS